MLVGTKGLVIFLSKPGTMYYEHNVLHSLAGYTLFDLNLVQDCFIFFCVTYIFLV